MPGPALESAGHSFTWYPWYRATFGRFTAPDPWADGGQIEWTVDLYELGQEHDRHAAHHHPLERPRRLESRQAIGITAADGRSYHVLPVFLRDLWLSGQVKDADLPGLVHRVEGPLKLRHYVSSWRFTLNLLRWAYGVIGALLAVAGCVVAAVSDAETGLTMLGAAVALQCLGPAQWWWMRRGERRRAQELVAARA